MWVAMVVEGAKFLLYALGLDLVLEMLVTRDCDGEFGEVGEDHR